MLWQNILIVEDAIVRNVTGEAVAFHARSMQHLPLMFLDVDHFKQINDKYGHARGDAVLKEFGGRLRETHRATDVVPRLAGDVHSPDRTSAELGTGCRVVAKVAEAMHKPFELPDVTLHVTTSVGAAIAAPQSDGFLPLDANVLIKPINSIISFINGSTASLTLSGPY